MRSVCQASAARRCADGESPSCLRGPEYRPRIGATYQAERYPIFKAPGYVIESGGKRINIRANECVEV
nr:MAG TPA: hypothetical protein [Bacteriophage sp.]